MVPAVTWFHLGFSWVLQSWFWCFVAIVWFTEFFLLPSFAELQLVPFFFSPPLHFKLRTSLRAIFFFVGRWDRRRRDGRWEEEEEEGEGASSGVGAAN